LAHVLAGVSPTGIVREDVVASWRESATLGLVPDRFDPPFDGDIDVASALLRAAAPVVDQLGTDLAGTRISVALADRHRRIAERRVAHWREEGRLDRVALAPGYHWGLEHAGTNGLGVAHATRRPTLIHGGEHFADALTSMVTAATPIRDPRTAQILGVLALVCPVEAANQLLLPMANRVAREIERRLLDGSSAVERLLQEEFLRARRRTRGALAVVSADLVLTNAAAALLLTPADHPRLWEFAAQRLTSRGGQGSQVVLADGTTVDVAVEAVRDGDDVAGAAIRLRRSDHPRPRSTGSGRSAPGCRPAFGWASLTDAELHLIELVTDGFTNREAAARLFLSAHTIDSHLRHIYRKLDINSRVDLTRIVTARGAAKSPVGVAPAAETHAVPCRPGVVPPHADAVIRAC
jgi:transcriptional regulator of acetoin/glycerol metabolism